MDVSEKAIGQGLLTAAECAGRTGLTVRTLRLYEQYGLLSPVRTRKNWRLYGERELARLNEVLALKQLGMSLASIAALLGGRATDLGGLLELQRDALARLKDRADRGLGIVSTLQSKLQAGGSVSLGDLLELAKETNMSDLSSESIAWRRYEQARPRTETPIDPKLCAECAGFYRGDSARGIEVADRDGRLFVRLVGQPELEVFPEGPDRVFYKAVPAQIEFVRDDKGAVSGLVIHQHGLLIPASRVDEAAFRAIEAAFAEKVASNTPYPGGEAAVREILAAGERGEISDRIEPQLAAIARDQAPIMKGLYERLGALKAVAFKGVDPRGLDRYEAVFEHGALEVNLALGPDGKVPAMGIRPLR
jgi:DNA-binding transcriptional MerR regulator